MYIKTQENIIHILPDIVYMIDNKGYFQFVNDSVNILGYEPQELIGMHFSILIHPDDTENIRWDSAVKKRGKNGKAAVNPKLFDERRTGERITKKLNARLVPKNWDNDGKNIFCEIFAIGIHDDGPDGGGKEYTGTIGIIRDITGLKNTEKNMIKIKEYYQSLITSASEIYSILALDGTILSISPSVKPIMDVEPYDLIGENIAGLVHPDDRQVFIINFKIIVENPELPETIKIRFKNREGGTIHLQTSFRGVRDENNEVTCLVLTSRDISEIIETKNQLMESGEKYYKILEEIHDAYAELDASGVIQLCNSAMAAICGNPKEELLQKKFADILAADQRNKFFHELEIISDNKTPMEFRDMTIKRRDGSVIFADISISPKLSRDNQLLGFRIIFRDTTEKKIYEEELKKARAGALLQDEIKSMFFTNLSLEIKKFIDATSSYSGKITDKSLRADKMEFLNYIKESGSRILSMIESSPDGRYKILVAEDNIVEQRLYKSILENSGYTVDITDNGYGAVSKFQGDVSIKAILMDIVMPDMDGFDAVRQIRVIEQIKLMNKRVPVIAVTSSMTEDEKEKCLAGGFDDVLIKPVDRNGLLEAVKKLHYRNPG